MAAQSCKFMLWQQAVAKEKKREANRLKKALIRDLLQLQSDCNKYWPKRNKATPPKHWPFLQWRLDALLKRP